MTESPTPLQTLFLWSLLARGEDGAFLNEMKPELKAKDRRFLEQTGLIETERRKKQRPGKRATAAFHATLTDKGWEWAAAHLDAEVSPRSTAAGSVLRLMMTRLKNHLRRRNCSLAEFIVESDAASSAENNGHDAPRRVRAAYRELTRRQTARRARLCDLRAALDNVPRAHLDDALLQMEREGSLVLYPLDDPREIRPEDERAALSNSAGQQRHIIYMEN